MQNNATSRLLGPTYGEDNRKAHIRSWLEDCGFDVEGEYGVGGGDAIDLYLPNRRVLIETKKVARLDNGPDAKRTGSRGDETAFEQLTRYVLAEREREHLYPQEDINDLPWLGAVTDKHRWWIWRWPVHGKGGKPRPIKQWQGRKLDQQGIHDLHHLLDRRVGKPWAPKSIAGLFSGSLESLRSLYEKNKDLNSARTMRSLWLRQLRVSGNAPAREDEQDLFLLHTFLIAVSSAISESVSRDTTSELGFAAWVNLEDSEWYQSVKEIVDGYDWRQRSGDLLRSLYMELVPARHRKVYGEFYTPDWLAEKMCLEVLDDEWIRERIEQHHEGMYSGVLDPACGSGTFLFHAVKRIINSRPVRDSRMAPRDLTGMLIQLVNGIDIHPVAVAMSKTNVLRAMPSVASRQLRVWQGDSLQTDRKDACTRTLFEDENQSVLVVH